MADAPHNLPSSAGYDTSRVHVRAVFIFIACFLLTLTLLLLTIWRWELRLLAQAPTKDPRVLFPPAPALAQPLQPSPTHPTTPWEDLAALHAQQQAQLHSASPIPGDPAHSRIPIDQAIDELLRSGEFNRPWQNPATQPYQRLPAEKNPSVENRT